MFWSLSGVCSLEKHATVFIHRVNSVTLCNIILIHTSSYLMLLRGCPSECYPLMITNLTFVFFFSVLMKTCSCNVAHDLTMDHHNINSCLEEWETLSNEYRSLEVSNPIVNIIFLKNLHLMFLYINLL